MDMLGLGKGCCRAATCARWGAGRAKLFSVPGKRNFETSDQSESRTSIRAETAFLGGGAVEAFEAEDGKLAPSAAGAGWRELREIVNFMNFTGGPGLLFQGFSAMWPLSGAKAVPSAPFSF
jgi:hypothetical protein